MGLKDKMNTRFKNWGSKRNEKSDIKDIEQEIENQENLINEMTANIGLHYWNMFSKNALVPDHESMQYFTAIKNALLKIKELNEKIEEVKRSADEERVNNTQELQEKEKRDAAEAAQRKKLREQQKAREKEEKAKEKRDETQN